MFVAAGRKHTMKTKLQEIRKARGFKSAKEFAEHAGMNVSTYTDYEQGRSGFSLEKAWEFADILDCSLDELAGRKRPRKEFADQEQESLNRYYESMNRDGRTALLSSARLMSGSPDVRIEKDRQENSGIQTALGA